MFSDKSILSQLTLQGRVIFWDTLKNRILCDYSYDHKYKPKGTHLSLSEETKTLLACYENDDIIALDVSQVEKGNVTFKWKINNSNKGKITSAFLNSKFLLTGNDQSVM